MRNNAGNSEEINVVYLKALEIYDASAGRVRGQVPEPSIYN